MTKYEKQVVTRLNKKLEKYGLTREEVDLKLHLASLYGKTVKKMPHCYNHDVATCSYECPYADVVDNTIMCTTDSCWYQYNKYANPLNKSRVVDNQEKIDFDNLEDYPF